MTVRDSRMIRCPLCGSHGARLHHDVRASLVYSCQKCLHEWQMDSAAAAPQADATVAQGPGTPSARSKPSRKQQAAS
jgi:ribosome-binding protein aMBF1 (putative translation factor)